MLTETAFTRLMLDAQGDPHSLALLLETTRAELLDEFAHRAQCKAAFDALEQEHAQAVTEMEEQMEIREHAIEHNAGEAKRWHNKFIVLARAAVPFFDDWLSLYVRFDPAALNADAREMQKTAQEMLQLIALHVE